MRIFRHYNDLPFDSGSDSGPGPGSLLPPVVALGNFDGVHQGHQAVIGRAAEIAAQMGAPLGVVTFEPHPRSYFEPSLPSFRLTPMRSKAHFLESLGVDVLFMLHFDKALAGKTAQDFIRQVLIDGLCVRHVVTGYDFVFGKGRGGDCNLLALSSKELGFGYTRVDCAVDEKGEAFSSSLVREFLRVGNPERAAGVLGRNYEIEGRVVPGEGRGRQLGIPTANIHFTDHMAPAKGVYAIRAAIEPTDSKDLEDFITDEGTAPHWRDGVANFGTRPTFEGSGEVLEVHLFDFDGDLYGKHMRVALHAYLRAEKKFDGIEALKAQITDDMDRARSLFSL